MTTRARILGASLLALLLGASGCGSTSSEPEPLPAAAGGGAGQAIGGAGGSPGSAVGGSSGGAGTEGGAPDAMGPAPSDGGPPPGFWDASGIPAAKNVMVFKFLNRTNGKYQDGEVYWSFKHDPINEVHSIAEQPLYDMPANSSGRMYFYLGQPDSKYYDFIEFTIGATRFNGNTTRVDAFGLKIAMRMHCADGYDIAVGEDYPTFLEDRAVTFQHFQDEVPDEFKSLGTMQAPYRILEPGAGEFKAGGLQEHYYDAYIDEVWTTQGLTIAKPGPNCSGLGAEPSISAALFRHTALLPKAQWEDASKFYAAPPANYYAKFWHTHGLLGRAYGFPYDDVGGYSSYISHDNPQYMLVAIGW